MNFLKNHPFGVDAHFESSIVLTFAFPKEKLQKFIPECLELDTLDNKWAFLAIAIVDTKKLRPTGFPSWLGNKFTLVGYRIFVKYTNTRGKRLRGLYILKSETNKRKMEFLGNIFTNYNYKTTDIQFNIFETTHTIFSKKSEFNVIYKNESSESISLPTKSPFLNWKEARKFAGPLPHTFSYNPLNKKVLIIEGVRQNWIPLPLQIKDYHFSFLKEIGLENEILANAFIINNIPYSWKKGKIETWK